MEEGVCCGPASVSSCRCLAAVFAQTPTVKTMARFGVRRGFSPNSQISIDRFAQFPADQALLFVLAPRVMFRHIDIPTSPLAGVSGVHDGLNKEPGKCFGVRGSTGWPRCEGTCGSLRPAPRPGGCWRPPRRAPSLLQRPALGRWEVIPFNFPFLHVCSLSRSLVRSYNRHLRVGDRLTCLDVRLGATPTFARRLLCSYLMEIHFWDRAALRKPYHSSIKTDADFFSLVPTVPNAGPGVELTK